MQTLIVRIKELFQIRETSVLKIAGEAMANVPSLQNAWLLIRDGLIHDFGPMDQVPETQAEVFDADDSYVLPAWCDSHTHLVFAGSREHEFVDKINGLSYEEIAKRGGGILNSANRLNDASEEALYNSAQNRLKEVMHFGTGAIEIKSGYGLSFEGEMKMLRVIDQLKKSSLVTIKSTFLGAHAIPESYKNNRVGYMDLLIGKLLPAIADENLADYCDVFCDKGFFTPTETDRILKAASSYGLVPKIHANELDYSGGVQVGVANGALSVDHLECIGDEEIKCLLQSDTMPTLLPGTAFYLNMEYPPARRMIDSGLPVALASDYNPGSCPSGNMPFVLSLASIKMKMLPEETLNAATLNGAYAIGLSNQLGSITRGKQANLIISKDIPSLAFIPYSFGSNPVSKLILHGKLLNV